MDLFEETIALLQRGSFDGLALKRCIERDSPQPYDEHSVIVAKMRMTMKTQAKAGYAHPTQILAENAE